MDPGKKALLLKEEAVIRGRERVLRDFIITTEMRQEEHRKELRKYKAYQSVLKDESFSAIINPSVRLNKDYSHQAMAPLVEKRLEILHPRYLRQKKTKKHLEKCKRKTEKLLKGSADKIEEIKARPFGIVDEENSEITEDPNNKPEDDESETQVSFKEGSEHSKSDHTIKDSKSIELNAAELASSLSKLQAEKAPNPDIKHGHLKVQNISETGPQPVGVKIITTEATKLDLEVGDLKIN